MPKKRRADMPTRKGEVVLGRGCACHVLDHGRWRYCKLPATKLKVPPTISLPMCWQHYLSRYVSTRRPDPKKRKGTKR